MIAHLKQLTIRNIVSPYGLAIISYCIFLFGWLFPPRLYTSYVGEPDLMFLDPLTFAFYTSCVGAFLLGVRFTHLWQVPDRQDSSADISVGAPLAYVAVPILLLTLPCAVFMVLAGTKLNSIVLLASQQGQAIKAAGETALPAPEWAKYQTFLTAILWWSLFRSHQLKLTGVSRFGFYVIFAVGLGVNVLTCVAMVNRTDLMPLLAGLLVVFLYRKAQGRRITLRRLFFASFASALSLTGCFLALSFLRGAIALRLLLISLMGYTIVSYNRLAAILSGVMHYAYGGNGVYLAQVLDQVERIDTLRKYFGWPSASVVWQTEFVSTYMAGLNSSFIWSSVFGYLYSDIGWWALLYLFGTGILAGIAWSRFTAGKTSGVVLYPWIAFCVLFWIGWNMLLETRVFRLFGLALLLWFYDRLFLRRTRALQQNQLIASLPDQALEPILNGHSGGFPN
jgi:hypothetical protein